MYRIIVLSEAEKFLAKLIRSDRTKFERILNSIRSLKTAPFQGKRLKHKLRDKYSLRVGIYRVIYQVDKKIVTVFIIDIGHRKEIYN